MLHRIRGMFLSIILCGIVVYVAKGEMAVDGVWGKWTDWNSCSGTCGHAIQTRHRYCNGPYHGGGVCHGLSTEIRHCNPSECQIDESVMSQKVVSRTLRRRRSRHSMQKQNLN